VLVNFHLPLLAFDASQAREYCHLIRNMDHNRSAY
jgi:hypothetical protein